MTNDDLLALDKMGFIPGPGEEEADFLSRVAKAKEKFEGGHWIPDSHWDWVRESLNLLFSVKPVYICAFYSNRRLPPWQGGAAWIEGKSLSSIQLRKELRKGSYLSLYTREEILIHEASHAARSGFDESDFEEFFAYMTSGKKWRRIFGPMIRKPWEVWPFLALSGIGCFWPAGYLGAAGWAALGFFRLIRQHWRLNKAARQIFKKTKDPKAARAVLFRLTDQEIKELAKGMDLESYSKKQNCLRWRAIKHHLKEGI